MNIEDYYRDRGMIVDTFLTYGPLAEMESEESTQEFLTAKEENEICEKLIDILKDENRLPELDCDTESKVYTKKF